MKLKITVHGVAYEVDVEILDPGEGFAPVQSLPRVSHLGGSPTQTPSASAAPLPRPTAPRSSAGSSGGITAPIAGTVMEVKCKPGDEVTEGQVILVVEAMKMNTSIAAPTNGKIKAIHVAAGDAIREGQTLIDLE